MDRSKISSHDGEEVRLDVQRRKEDKIEYRKSEFEDGVIDKSVKVDIRKQSFKNTIKSPLRSTDVLGQIHSLQIMNYCETAAKIKMQSTLHLSKYVRTTD
jgi:hypothetical protein